MLIPLFRLLEKRNNLHLYKIKNILRKINNTMERIAAYVDNYTRTIVLGAMIDIPSRLLVLHIFYFSIFIDIFLVDWYNKSDLSKIY